MGKIVVKEKEILQYTMKGLSLSYKKKGINTSFKLRNAIECPFNISYPIFSPIINSFSIENINHSAEQEDHNREDNIEWKKYKKSSGYHIAYRQKRKQNFQFVENKITTKND